MADVIGHEWLRLTTASPEQFKEKYANIIGNVANYPEYSIDFDRADAKNALCRGTSLFCEETEPPEKFDIEFINKRIFKQFYPNLAARTSIKAIGKPGEVFEAVYRIAKKLTDQ